MCSRLPYTWPRNRPILLLLVALVILLWSRPIRAEREADVEESIKRIRHGPVLPASPTGFKSADDQDDTYDPRNNIHYKRRNKHDGNHGQNTANDANNHEPYSLDPQRPSHPDPLDIDKRDEPASPPSAYTPIVTPAPDQEAVLASQGYKQVTFYTCNTIGGNEHCGWHVPVVKAQAVRRDSATVWVVVGCLAGVFALGLM